MSPRSPSISTAGFVECIAWVAGYQDRRAHFERLSPDAPERPAHAGALSPASFGVSARQRGEWDRLRSMGIPPRAAAVIVNADGGAS